MRQAGISSLSAQDLTYVHRGNRRALDGCTFEVKQSAVALMGPNGAGKSTLISLLVGSRQLQKGSIRIDGEDLQRRGTRRRLQTTLGYVPQHLRMWNGYTVGDILRYVGWLKGVNHGIIERRAIDALSAVGLEAEQQTKIGRLSGGMRQRLALAQALVNDPDVLILDEPTVGLDPEQRVAFRRFIRTVAEGRLLVFATHLVEDVVAVAEHVVVLREGAIAASAALQDFAPRADGAQPSAADVESAYLRVLQEH